MSVSLTGAASYGQVDGLLTVANYIWDTSTLAWIKATGGTSGASTVSVDNFPASQAVTGPLTNAELLAATVNTQSKAYAKRLDEVSSNLTYIGTAAVGVIDSSSSWQVQRMILSSTLTIIEWADGNANFDNAWSARGSSSYS